MMMLHRFDAVRGEVLHDITLPKSPRFFTLLEDHVHAGRASDRGAAMIMRLVAFVRSNSSHVPDSNRT